MNMELMEALGSMLAMTTGTGSNKYTPMSQEYVYLMKSMSKEFTTSNRFGGHQYRADFDNNYGISIIKHSGSYGGDCDKWEIAVMHDGDLCYDTPITNDVTGYLTAEEVIEYFFKIKFLPEK